MLTPEFIEERKEQLLTEKKETEAGLANIAKYDDEAGKYRPIKPDYGNSADADDYETDDFQEIMVKVDRANNLLDKIDRALGRIEGGSYGICIKCNVLMKEELLKAMPWAESCPQCEA